MEDVKWLDDEENGDCRVSFENGMVVVTLDTDEGGWFPSVIRDDVGLTLIEGKLTDLETAKHRGVELWALLGELIATDVMFSELTKETM